MSASVVEELQSIIQRSRAAMEREDLAEVEALAAQGIPIARGLLESAPEKNESYASVLDGLASLYGSRAVARVEAGDIPTAIGALSDMIACLEALHGAGFEPNDNQIEGAGSLTQHLMEQAAPESAVATSCFALLQRLEALLPGTPNERAIVASVDGLRAMVAHLREQEKMGDKPIAEILIAAACRGETHGVPILEEFARVAAGAMARRSVNVALIPMALETGGLAGKLDESLDELEALFLTAEETDDAEGDPDA